MATGFVSKKPESSKLEKIKEMILSARENKLVLVQKIDSIDVVVDSQSTIAATMMKFFPNCTDADLKLSESEEV